MKNSAVWLLMLGVLFVGCSKDEQASAPATPTNPTGESPATPDATAPEAAAPEKSTEPAKTSENAKPSEPVAVAANGLDLSYISEDFTGAFIIHPARLLNSPLIKELQAAGLPIDQPLKEMEREFGVDPATVDQVIVLLDKDTALTAPMMLGPGMIPGPGAVPVEPLEDKASDAKPEGAAAIDGAVASDVVNLQPGAGEQPTQMPFPTVIVRFNQAPDQTTFYDNFPPLEEKEVDGMKVKSIPEQGIEGSFYFINDKTLIVTRTGWLKKLVGTKSADSKLIQSLKQIDAGNDIIAAGDLTPIKPFLVEIGNQAAKEVPPFFVGLTQIPQKSDVLAITAGLNGDNLLEIAIQSDTEQGATEINAVFTLLSSFGKQSFEGAKAQFASAPSPLEDADKQKLIALATDLVNGISNSSSGKTARLTVKKPEKFNEVVVIVKPILEQMKKQAERVAKMNNFKQIGLAMHNYHDTFAGFPGAGSNRDGSKKGLSWRVHILPYLEEYALYEQFNLDEPWDSEHNKKLIPLMPQIYAVEGLNEEGKTSIHVIVGEQAFAVDKGMSISEFTDGTSLTILAVQAGNDKADVWTKPGGLEINADDPIKTVGSVGEQFLVLMTDGSVHLFEKMINPETLKGLFTRNGGEVINYDDF